MELLDLGHLPGQRSMLVFHALARMGFEGLVVVSPSSPLVSVGYFQDAAREVDLEYCRKEGIPVTRREVGGGATYLDGNQIFYQVIWKKGHPRMPVRITDVFEHLSGPPCQTYGDFGIPARFRPSNDIVTREGRKIAGEGGGDIGDSMVFVGGILMDFDYRAMSNVLRVPDEKFRDKVHRTMEENLTNMRRELGEAPPREGIVASLITNFEKALGRLEPTGLTPAVLDKMAELERAFTSEAFLFKRTPRRLDGAMTYNGTGSPGVKIKEGVEIMYSTYKAPGGLVRTVQEVRGVVMEDISITGDFQMFPVSGLSAMERELSRTERRPNVIETKLEDFYDGHRIESPGVRPADITEAVMAAR